MRTTPRGKLAVFLALLCSTTAFAVAFPTVAPFTLTSGTTTPGTTLTTASQGVNITFPAGAGFPSVTWRAGTSWNWTAGAQVGALITNNSASPVSLYYLISDGTNSIYANGTGATIAAGATETVLIDLTPGTSNDSRSVYGLDDPPPAATGSGVWMADQSGAINLSHVTYYEIFMNSPASSTSINVRSILLYEPSPIKALYTGIVDQFGQFTNTSWTNKITSTGDFATRFSQENSDISAHPNVGNRDSYGGWTAGPSLTAPGFFQATQRSGVWWMVDPGGRLFLSFGFNGVWPGGTPAGSNSDTSTITSNRTYMYQSIPVDSHASTVNWIQYGPFVNGTTYNTYDFYGANADHKYGTTYGSGDYKAPWATHTVSRLQSWGFDTIGSWSDWSRFTGRIPYTIFLTSGGSDYINGVPDPYDSTFATKADTSIKNVITTTVASDPWCVGFFCDNEIPWSGVYPTSSDYLTNTSGRYSLAIHVLACGSTQPAKAAFQGQMQTKYGTIGNLNSAWGTSFASWTAFLNPYTVPGSPNGNLVADMQSFTTAFAAKYFSTIKTTIRKYDVNHLYLGSRFATASPEVVQGAAQSGSCDVISFNVYTGNLDPSTWAFTTGLGKPCMVSEFHFGAMDSGMFGYGTFTTTRAISQQDRADKYTAYMQSVLALPAFVGAHWFQYMDEPLTGRYNDGEDYNIGFVDVGDTVYSTMVAAARSIHGQAYTLHQNIAALKFETESLTVPNYFTAAGGTERLITDDPSMSGSTGTILDAANVGDYVTFTVPNVAAGTYDVRVRVKRFNTRGIWQLSVGRSDNFSGTASNVGTPQDEYASVADYPELDLGLWSPGSTSDKWFRFQVTGKSAASSSYSIAFDYILLVPQ